jgi:hypothetical protein
MDAFKFPGARGAAAEPEAAMAARARRTSRVIGKRGSNAFGPGEGRDIT